jgi:site-specific recombinase XerD
MISPKEKSHFDTLYQKHLTALKRQGKADKTIDAYARAVRRLADFVEPPLDQLSIDELKSFFSALINTHSWSTVKLDLNGLRFFYKHVINQELPWIDIVKPPKVQSMPDILTPDEIARIIHQTRDLRLQSFWFITYSMGLRLSETLNITVADIDRERHTLHVRQSKGLKDRFVILPQMSLAVLQRLWRSHRHPRLLFPGRPLVKGGHAAKTMHRGTTQRAFTRAYRASGIEKHVSIHSLRHSYATHLIEAGLNLRSLQQQLGHSDPQTTARYVRLTEKSKQNSADLIDHTLSILATALRKQQVTS